MTELRTETDLIRERCVASRFDLSGDKWKMARDMITPLEVAEFGDNAFTPETFEEELTLDKTILILLRDGQQVVGFTYAFPLIPHFEGEMEPVEREDEGKKTAYVNDTVIDPTYRGHQLVGKMMDELEKQLVQEGFEFLERDARTANNYAANIEKNYRRRGLLLLTGQPHDSTWGKQCFFRIKLPA